SSLKAGREAARHYSPADSDKTLTMKPPDKKWPRAQGAGPPSQQRANPAYQFKPAVAQSKSAVSAGAGRHPVAPPVYRPQVSPPAAQRKSAAPAQAKPPAPPAYRPQPLPKVLQRKVVLSQQPPRPKTERQPVATTTGRPRPTPGVLQAKAADPRPAFYGQRQRHPAGLAQVKRPAPAQRQENGVRETAFNAKPPATRPHESEIARPFGPTRPEQTWGKNQTG